MAVCSAAEPGGNGAEGFPAAGPIGAPPESGDGVIPNRCISSASAVWAARVNIISGETLLSAPRSSHPLSKNTAQARKSTKTLRLFAIQFSMHCAQHPHLIRGMVGGAHQ